MILKKGRFINNNYQTAYYGKHKTFRNHVLSKLRKAEREHYRQLFELNEHDSRKSWDILKTIIGKEKKNSPKRLCEFIINNSKI